MICSFHFYEPWLLTTLGAYQPGLEIDRLSRTALSGRRSRGLCGPACRRADPSPANSWDHCHSDWDAARLRSRFRQAAEWGRRNQAALLAGEFGARNRLNRPARLTWMRAVRSGLEAEGIGWALWGYADSSPGSPCGVHPGTDQRWIRSCWRPWACAGSFRPSAAAGPGDTAARGLEHGRSAGVQVPRKREVAWSPVQSASVGPSSARAGPGHRD